MNAIRQTQQLNRRELENATPPSASWHADYRDTAWIYVGGFPLDLSEGDVVTIFSQFGNPTHLNLIRDRETGKSKGFGFLKYEDQRSCDLAVDNLGGAEVLGRMLRVDHTRYKKRDDEDEETYKIDRLEAEIEAEKQRIKRASETESEDDRERKRRGKRKEIKDGVKKLAITENGEEDDPMKDYLARERRRGGDERNRERRGDNERVRERRHRHRDREHDRKHQKNSRDDQDTRKRRHREDEDVKDDRMREDRREQRHRRRGSYSPGSESERREDRSTRRGDRKSRQEWKDERSRSPENRDARGRDFVLESSGKGRSSKPSRLKFKGDD